MQEFQFKFMVMTVKASLDDDALTVRQGLRTFRADVGRLRHLYVIDHEGVGQEMILTHEAGPDKLKRIRFNANFGEGQFEALIEALLARRPEIDIRNLPSAEAHRLMGATNFVAWAPIIGVSLIVGLVAVFFLPALIHGLDSGSQRIDVAVCAEACEVDSYNLIVSGRLLTDQTAEKETTTTRSGSTSTTIRYFIPLVPADWKPGDLVHMVVETPDLVDSEFEELSSLPAIPGVLRDVLWEGLGDEAVAFFQDSMGLKMAPSARLLEYRADPRQEMWIGLIVVGVVLLIMVAVAIAVARKKRR